MRESIHPSSNPPRPQWLSTTFIFLLLLTLTAPAQGLHSGFRPGRLVIQPTPNHHAPTLNQLNTTRGRRVLKEFKALNHLQVIELAPGSDVKQAARDYQASGLVEFAEPDYYLYPANTPNDPRYLNGSLWQFNNTGQSGGQIDADIDGPEAWDTLHSASNIIIAIVDTGVRATHEDLAANMWINPDEIPGNNIDDDNNGIIDDIHGIHVTANSGDPRDNDGHGTQVASTAGAVGNNGLGITGVAWKVQIMACRFYDDTGAGSLSDAVTCFDYARSKGAHIVNASFVSTVFSSTLSSAITRLRNDGIILVTAAGNDGINNDTTPYYPASYSQDNIVAVASTTRSDLLSGFSNFGATSVDLAAPGSSLHLAFSSSDTAYIINNGSSFSSPMVAGALALIKARYPNDTYQQSIDRLLNATDPIPSLAGRCVTGGRLNLANALGPSLVADFTASPPGGEPPLDVQFTDTSFGNISTRLWTFGDGSTSTTQNPSHRYQAEGIFTATLTVTGTSGLTSRFSQDIAIVPNYTIENGSFSWINPSSMTPLPLTNEGVSPAQPLPFPFVFYGQTHNEFYVGANGLIGFQNLSLGSSANQNLPNPNSPNAIICPFWDDLSPATGGTVYVGTVGSTPNRRTVITWSNVRYTSNPPFSPDFQIILEETTHRILFQYLDVERSRNSGSRGARATIGVEDASGLVAAQYSFNGSRLVSNNQSIVFVPGWSGGILTAPAGNLALNGNIGGPFSPPSSSYTILNTSQNTLPWSATHTESWLSVSPQSGTLAPGQSATVTVSANSIANSLLPGTYLDQISIVNETDGTGNAIRSVSLQVNGTIGTLEVTPANPFISSGPAGGPFSPTSRIYTLANVGDTPFDWSAGLTSTWASLSITGGRLAPGTLTNLTVAIAPAAQSLSPGVHLDLITFSNLTHRLGSTNRFMALTLTQPPPGTLAVSPLTQTTSSGLIGGPFLPSAHSYTLTNTGTVSLNWTAQTTTDWVNLSPNSGSLGSGQSTQVIATLNPNALLLDPGTHTAILSFSNTTSGNGNASRTLELTVDPPARLQALPVTLPGQFDFILIGTPETTYVIESATSPANWTPVSTNTTGITGRALISQPITPLLQFFRAHP